MANFRLLPFFFGVVFIGLSPSVAQDTTAGSGAVNGLVREPRSHAKRLCRKYGICNGGGFQGGYQGYQGNFGYQGGNQQPYPPINIAISQSQSSANEAGGGYSNGYYPHNYQYNGGHQYPGHGYPNYQRPGGYYGNGQGAHNNQFNGNYYGPSLGQHGGGGYGFQGPVGYFDENPDDNEPNGNQEDAHGAGAGGAGVGGPGGHNDPSGPGGYNDYPGRNNEGGQNGGNFAVAGSFAAVGRQN